MDNNPTGEQEGATSPTPDNSSPASGQPRVYSSAEIDQTVQALQNAKDPLARANLLEWLKESKDPYALEFVKEHGDLYLPEDPDERQKLLAKVAENKPQPKPRPDRGAWHAPDFDLEGMGTGKYDEVEDPVMKMIYYKDKTTGEIKGQVPRVAGGSGLPESVKDYLEPAVVNVVNNMLETYVDDANGHADVTAELIADIVDKIKNNVNLTSVRKSQLQAQITSKMGLVMAKETVGRAAKAADYEKATETLGSEGLMLMSHKLDAEVGTTPEGEGLRVRAAIAQLEATNYYALNAAGRAAARTTIRTNIAALLAPGLTPAQINQRVENSWRYADWIMKSSLQAAHQAGPRTSAAIAGIPVGTRMEDIVWSQAVAAGIFIPGTGRVDIRDPRYWQIWDAVRHQVGSVNLDLTDREVPEVARIALYAPEVLQARNKGKPEIRHLAETRVRAFALQKGYYHFSDLITADIAAIAASAAAGAPGGSALDARDVSKLGKAVNGANQFYKKAIDEEPRFTDEPVKSSDEAVEQPDKIKESAKAMGELLKSLDYLKEFGDSNEYIAGTANLNPTFSGAMVTNAKEHFIIEAVRALKDLHTSRALRLYDWHSHALVADFISAARSEAGLTGASEIRIRAAVGVSNIRADAETVVPEVGANVGKNVLKWGGFFAGNPFGKR